MTPGNPRIFGTRAGLAVFAWFASCRNPRFNQGVSLWRLLSGTRASVERMPGYNENALLSEQGT